MKPCLFCDGKTVIGINFCFICHGTGTFNELNYTCGKCVSKEDCPYAWDPYNTNGDCIAMK